MFDSKRALAEAIAISSSRFRRFSSRLPCPAFARCSHPVEGCGLACRALPDRRLYAAGDFDKVAEFGNESFVEYSRPPAFFRHHNASPAGGLASAILANTIRISSSIAAAELRMLSFSFAVATELKNSS